MKLVIIVGVTLLLAAGLVFLFSGYFVTAVIMIFISLIIGAFFIRF